MADYHIYLSDPENDAFNVQTRAIEITKLFTSELGHLLKNEEARLWQTEMALKIANQESNLRYAKEKGYKNLIDLETEALKGIVFEAKIGGDVFELTKDVSIMNEIKLVIKGVAEFIIGMIIKTGTGT